MSLNHTPPQDRIFRAVAGAARNAAHGHPGWKITRTMAHSIAKRATGTLSAQWPEVLAARSVPSDKAGEMGSARQLPFVAPAPSRRRTGRRASLATARVAGRRSPLPLLWRQLSMLVGDAKKAGMHERAEAIIDVLKLIASMQQEREAP